MPKYLYTTGISSNLEQLIREAHEKLYIISPYIKLSETLKERFNDKEREKVEVRIVFGKQELNPAELSYLQSLKYVRLYFSKNLHAKCYLNEKRLIICSMNLYEYSQVNNKEMGILIEREIEADKQVYDDAWKDIESILNNAQDFAYGNTSFQKTNGTRKQLGYCIRTGAEIAFNVEKPLCPDAFKNWSKYSDSDYPEKFCHFSGEQSNGETSMSKPILKKNWKKAKETFDL